MKFEKDIMFCKIANYASIGMIKPVRYDQVEAVKIKDMADLYHSPVLIIKEVASNAVSPI